MNDSKCLDGRCHCGSISFDFHTEIAPEEITPRACSCALCSRHGAKYISDPQGELKLSFTKDAKVNRYRFGTETADFIVCKNCGCLVAALCEIDGTLRAVLNANNLSTQLTTAPTITNFHGESVKERLSRRGKNWTGKVSETYHESHPAIINACG